MRHVFISYMHDDSPLVDKLARELKASGIEVWLDKNDIEPGARWQSAISDAISSGDFFLACFSQAYSSRSSSYTNEELTLAIEELRKKPTNQSWFIPVKLNKCTIPRRAIGAGETLHSLQWVELYTNWDEGIKRIIAVIRPETPIYSEISTKIAEDKPPATDSSGNTYFVEWKLNKQSVLRKVFSWLVKGEFVPKDLIEKIAVASYPIYIPFYCLSLSYSSKFSVSIGYQNSSQTDQKTPVPEWIPFTEKTEGKISNFLILATDISKRVFVSQNLYELVQFLETSKVLNDFKLVEPDDITQVERLPILLNLEDALSDRQKKRIEKIIYDAVDQYVQKRVTGDQKKDMRIDPNYQIVNKQTVYLPFWFIKYQYENQFYWVCVDCQDPSREVKGSKPRDPGWWILLIGTLVVCFLISFLFLYDWGAPTGVGTEIAATSYLSMIISALLTLVALLVKEAITRITLKSSYRKLLEGSLQLRTLNDDPNQNATGV